MSDSDNSESNDQQEPQLDPLMTEEQEVALKSILDSEEEDEIRILEQPLPDTQDMFSAIAEDQKKLKTSKAVKKAVTFKSQAEQKTFNVNRIMRKTPPRRGSGVSKKLKTVQLTNEQQTELWEKQENNFLNVLLLLWNPALLTHLVPFLNHISIMAMNLRDTQLKKRILIWTETIQTVQRKVGENFATLSFQSFKNTLQNLSSYTAFIALQLDDKTITLLLDAYALFEPKEPTQFKSSAGIMTTSTSCTTAPTTATSVAASSSAASNIISEPTKQKRSLFGNICSAPPESLVPCSISKKVGEGWATCRSDGARGDLVLKLDLLPYASASSCAKKDWWKECQLRTTVSFAQNSALDRATKQYLAVIEEHFLDHLGPIKEELIPQRTGWGAGSYSGYGNTQRRPS